MRRGIVFFGVLPLTSVSFGVSLDPATVFRASIGEDSQDRQVVLLVKRQHFVVQHIRRRNRGFGGVQFGLGDLGIGINIGLLINPPDALQGSHIERILRAKVTGMGRFDLAPGLVVQFLLLQRLDLGLGQHGRHWRP